MLADVWPLCAQQRERPCISEFAVRVHQLCSGAVIELTPSAEGVRELRGGLGRNSVREFLSIGCPRRCRRRELGIDTVEDAAHRLRRPGRQLRICKDFGNVFLYRQTRIGEIEDMRNIRCQLPCGFGKPDRVEMGYDEVTVRELKCWRPHYASYHRFGLAEIILVLRALRRAIGHNQGGLTGSPRATGTLRVVGWGRRHVAHVDGIERRDIDAEFHGRRTEQHRQEDVGLADEAQLSLWLRRDALDPRHPSGIAIRATRV